MAKSDFQPNWVSAPSNTIIDILVDKQISLGTFAQNLNRSVEFANNLVSGYISINYEIACDLEKILGSSKEFWIQRESDYRNGIARLKELEETNWLKELPIKDMIKFGWISNTLDVFQSCLNYFNVDCINAWREKYNKEIILTSFRTSSSFKSEQGSVAAWLRKGEILSTKINTKPWSEELFEQSLEKIRPLTRKKNPKDFLPQLIDLCAECGVAVSIIRTPSGCKASGATKFLTPDKALILLSFRYLSDDHFWFTFFHEAGHLILHGNKSVFIEEIGSTQIVSIEENEANSFAGEMLIPYELQDELANIKGNKRKIIDLATRAGVSPGIIVGQLQHHGYAERKYLNSYKRRYNWDEIDNLV